MAGQTEIRNRELQKPWMMIACYETSFDNYINVTNRMEKLNLLIPVSDSETKTKLQTQANHFKLQLRGISEHPRDLDQQIHNYISSHQL